ncbi:MAG: tail fiber domain-containing protein [Acidobacteria bacterium]|nr:tail fiber domain-containing protein [Acidobacteriota bacterium]
MLHQVSHRWQPTLVVLASLLLLSGAAVAQTGNTVAGTNAFLHNTTGSQDSTFGQYSLYWNSTGYYNSAFGYQAMGDNTSGQSNVAIGSFALGSTTGNGNTALGASSLSILKTGSSDIAVGVNAGNNYSTSESNDIVIGNNGMRGENGVIRIGSSSQTATYIAGISGATSASGLAVYVDTSGHLGTTTSSQRFKEEVRTMGNASRSLMQLRPVTFYYKPQFDDGSHLLQYGLIAEEVAKVYPGLVQYDDQGRPLSVRYQFVNAMLLNEVQEQHRQLADQQAKIEKLEQQVQALFASQQQ